MRLLKKVILLLFSLVLLWLALISKNTFNKKPNLILISVDALQAKSLGIYGNRQRLTPNIDQFAKEAIVFDNFFTLSPLTKTSFYTLFTGQDDVLLNEANVYQILENKQSTPTTLTQILKKHGYYTNAIITNPVLGKIYPFFSKSFDEFDFIQTNANKGAFVSDYQNSQTVTKKALQWLEKTSAKPFFLWLHYSNPHLPYNPPEKYICKHEANFCDIEAYSSLLSDESQKTHSILGTCPSSIIAENTIKLTKDLYDTEVMLADKEIGKILESINQSHLNNNTIIIIYSDHGEGFDHNIFNHGSALYNSAIHIPLIIKDIEKHRNYKIKSLADNSDLLPTILDLLKISYAKSEISGQTLVPDFNLVKPIGKKEIIVKTPYYRSNKYALINEKYKLILSFSNKCLSNNQIEELYSYQTDYEELDNLLYQQREVTIEMKTKLIDFIDSKE